MGLNLERHRRKVSFLRRAEVGRIKGVFRGIVERDDLRPLEPDHVQDHALIFSPVVVRHKIEKASAKISERIGIRRAFDQIPFHPI